MEEEVSKIVIDTGSSMVKAGFAGEDAPHAAFPTIIGRPRNTGMIMVGMGRKEWYVGDEAVSKQGILRVKNPVEHGNVVNWDDVERVWQHTFYNELRVAPEEHLVLLTEAYNNPRVNREKACQIMIENFDVPAMYLSCSNVLDLNAAGKTTGLSVSLGDSTTHCVPVYEGHAIRHAGGSMEGVHGAAISSGLQKLLNEAEQAQPGPQRIVPDLIADIKRSLCYVALDYERDAASPASEFEKSFELPDGNSICLRSERFRFAESYFQPSLLGLDGPSLPRLVDTAIQSCVPVLRDRTIPTSETYLGQVPAELLLKIERYVSPFPQLEGELYGNIVISGGSSMFPGLADRLQNELVRTARRNTKVNVIATPERKHQTWIGGSVLASLSTFESMWVSKEMYDECGPSIIHSRCF